MTFARRLIAVLASVWIQVGLLGCDRPEARRDAPSPSLASSALPSAGPAPSAVLHARGALDASAPAADGRARHAVAVWLAKGSAFDLEVPHGFTVRVAAEGLHRPRFMASSPDGRVFVTDLHDMSDNTKGAIFVTDSFVPATGRFTHVVSYLTGLRNPNSVAFHADGGKVGLYVALTDHLVRISPVSGRPQASRKSWRRSPTTASATNPAGGTSRALSSSATMASCTLRPAVAATRAKRPKRSGQR